MENFPSLIIYYLQSLFPLQSGKLPISHPRPVACGAYAFVQRSQVLSLQQLGTRGGGWRGEGSRAIPDDWTEKVVPCPSFLRYARFLKFSWVYYTLPQVSAGLWLNQVCRPELMQNRLRRGPPPAESHCPYCVQTVIASASQREHPQFCMNVKNSIPKESVILSESPWLLQEH